MSNRLVIPTRNSENTDSRAINVYSRLSTLHDACAAYRKHLVEESRPKPIPAPTYDNYSDDIRRQLAKLPT